MTEHWSQRSEEPLQEPVRSKVRPRPTPSHDAIMAKVKRDTYHCKAVIEVLGQHKAFELWTADEKRKVAKRQAKMRTEL